MEKGLDDTHGAPRFFLDNSAEAGTGNAYNLHQKISEYVKTVKEILGDDSSNVKFPFDVDKTFLDKDGRTVSWELKNFNEVVAGAGLVTLTRMKAETMNAEFDAVNMLYKQVSKGDMKFSDIALISRPKSTYIIYGGTYETALNVAAYDSKQKFTATIGGQTISSNDSGAVVYRTTCNRLGEQTLTAVAMVKTPDGEAKEVKVVDKYFVSEPLGAIQLEKMMVVYSGLDNPITVSAAGVDSRKINVSIDGGGTLRAGSTPGEWIIAPNGSKKEINISMTTTMDKRVMDLGTRKVRVKTIPAPIIKVAGYETGGSVSKKTFTEGMKVSPSRAPGFDFEIPKGSMRVTKLEVFISNKPYIVDGGSITAEMVTALKKASKGDMFAIRATVLMPDKKEQFADWMVKLK
jgi:gliding motility-associated protein GldM